MPPTTEIQAPPFVALHSTDIDDQTGDIIARFKAPDGKIFRVQFAAGIVPALTVILLAQAGRGKSRAASPQEFHQQPLTLTGCRPFVGPKGQPGLELHFDEGLAVPVSIPRGAAIPLRNELAKLHGLEAPPPKRRH